MTGPPVQRSLFPDAHEIEADALEALEELDPARGLELLDEARRRDPHLPNLASMGAALAWLGRGLGGATADVERVAELFLARPSADLPPGAAVFADRALARYGLRRSEGAFLDRGERVPRAALRLVEGQGRSALRELRPLVEERGERADLWSYLGDAATLADRPEEAEEAYLRALLLDPTAPDLFRLRHPGLRTLWNELLATRPEDEARALLPIEAWLRGLIPTREGREWLEERSPRLRAATANPSSSAGRLRRFGLLLHLDRTAPGADVTAREEMFALDQELFGRFMGVLRARE